MSLNEKDLYKNITGVAREPDDKTKPEYKKWKKTDLKAMNSIIQSIEAYMQDLFLYYDTAKDTWDAINKYFSKKRQSCPHISFQERNPSNNPKSKTNHRIHQPIKEEMGRIEPLPRQNHRLANNQRPRTRKSIPISSRA